MGQYYHPTMIDEAGNITWVYTHDYHNGLKLMEHSYIGNSVMNAVFGQIKDHPLQDDSSRLRQAQANARGTLCLAAAQNDIFLLHTPIMSS